KRPATEAWSGTRFVERQREYDRATETWIRSLTAAGLLSPLGMSAFLFLIALGYALSRLFYPQPVVWDSLSSDELDSIQIDLGDLDRLTGQLMRRWVYGLILPPLGGVLGQLGGELARLPWHQREYVPLGGMALFALIALVLLSLTVAAVRRSPAVAE